MTTANHPPPRLQIAQILADLSDLNVAEPDAALALLTAPQHLHLSTPKASSYQRNANNKSTSTGNGNSRPPLSLSSSFSALPPAPSRPGSRRRSSATPSRALPPPSRHDSSSSKTPPSAATAAGSGPWEGLFFLQQQRQTPRPGAEPDDPDLERAATLMRLYAARGRLKQQENGALARARADVEAVVERYRKLA